MKKTLLTISICAFAATAPLAHAQLFSNVITDTNPSATNPYTNGQVLDPNVTSTGILRATGLTASSAANRFSASGFNDVDLAASIAALDYYSFTITPINSASLNYGDVTFTLQGSTTGPTNFALLSSIGGFTAANVIATSGATNNATVTFTIADATLGTAYDAVTTATEFRLYGYGASAATGTGSVNDFSYAGVATVPEPSTYAMMAGGLGLLLLGQRVRRTARA